MIRRRGRFGVRASALPVVFFKGSVPVAFDDWFCWSASNTSGERIAAEEFLARHPEWRFVRFKEVFWGGMAFVVERTDSSQPPPANLLL